MRRDFHDLGASRLLEAGWPIHHVQEMLGHGSLEQTSTYLNVERGGRRESMRRIDEARSRCNSVAKEATIEQPSTYNGEEQNVGKTLVN